jgi:transglutaminase-like putative cysteine protease
MRRRCEGLLLGLLATGFATLAITGRLGWPVTVAVSCAFILRGVLFALGREWRISTRAWSLTLVAYLPVFALDGWWLSQSFLVASLHLVVLAGAARIFAPRQGRDDLLLGILAFLEVLTAALLTVSGVFLLLFLLFLALLVLTLVAQEMARAEAAAAVRLAAAERVPSGRLLRFSLLLTGLAVAVGGLVFFLLPRTTLGGWAARPLGAGLSGFSDEVRLGAIASLQESDRPIMHIRMMDATPPLAPPEFQRIPWRGRGLTRFDGQRWYDPEPPAVFGTEDGRIQVGRPAWREPAELVRYQVLLEPLRSPVLFFPPRLLSAVTHDPVLAWNNNTATLAGLASDATGGAYSGVSDLAVPSADDLRQAGDPGRARLRLRPFLELPPQLDPRIPALARAIVAGAPGDSWDRMQALATYLRTRYQYSLENLPVGKDPLAAFLFDQRSGDCEYFASALAVMGRSLGIPTRVVNGFLLGSYNQLTGEYLVRGRDAHSWVEVYFPVSEAMRRDGFDRPQWITFDATPAAGTQHAAAQNGAGMLLDALSSVWQEWVVNYDWLRQARLAGGLQGGVAGAAAGVLRDGGEAAAAAWKAALHPAYRRHAGWLITVVLSLSLALLALLSGWFWQRRSQRARQAPGHLDEAQQARARRAYRSFRRRLARLGVERQPGQTAEELLAALARRSPQPPLAQAAQRFISAYQAVRFGGGTAEETARLRAQLRQVRRVARKRYLCAQ